MGGKPDSFRASVLKGMMHFVELYHGEFSEERLLRALRSIHPVDIYRIGQDDPAKLRGWKKYVFPSTPPTTASAEKTHCR